jgi:hypothetical protein
MPFQFSNLTWQRRLLLSQAATDYFYLQNRSYPRISALEWTGNRYGLSRTERNLLRRGVFGQKEALLRSSKHAKGAEWQKEWLVVDGHNVHITIESALLGRLLLRANDGALRDLAGESARFRLREVSDHAMDALFSFLRHYPPQRVLFLFDAPMSQSGLLASEYRKRLMEIGLSGEARVAAVPEREFPYRECVVASSDGEVLDRSATWLDLARRVVDMVGGMQPAVDFSSFVLAKASDFYVL